MNALSALKPARKPRGLSIMEVMLSVFILSICALTILSASYTSASSVKQSAEYAAAVAAARRKMEEIQTTPFLSLVSRYGIGSRERTFKVFLNEGTEQNSKDAFGHMNRGVELPGFCKTIALATYNYDAGEIVIVNDEAAAPSTYGYACGRSPTDNTPDNNNPGGIGFNGIPIDLNGAGGTAAGTIANDKATRLPIGVVIRWDGPHGPERYELWTIISRY